MKIGVTGSSGVIGKNFTKQFSSHEFLEFQGRLEDPKSVVDFISACVGFDAILHLGGLVARNKVEKDPFTAFQTNVLGTLNLLEAIRNQVEFKPMLLLASTSHVYRSSTHRVSEFDETNPSSVYGKTKLQAEEWALIYSEKFNLDVAVARIFSFSCPAQSSDFFIPAMIKRIATAPIGSRLKIHGINGCRDFLTINQVCTSLEFLIQHRFTGIINIGTGIPIPLRYIVEKLMHFQKRTDLQIESTIDEPMDLYADVTKLNSIGLKLESKIDTLLMEMVRELHES